MSADPRPLFYVAAFVIAALAVWVMSILARKGEPWAREVAPAVPSSGTPVSDLREEESGLGAGGDRSADRNDEKNQGRTESR